MSDDVNTAATIASLRAEVERLKAELQGERDDLAACYKAKAALIDERDKYRDSLAVTTRDSNATFDGINAALDAAGIKFLDVDTYAACIGRLAKERDTARERAGVLEAEVRAWRHHDDVHECEPESEWLRRQSIEAHDRACRAAQETDRTHALDAAKFGKEKNDE